MNLSTLGSSDAAARVETTIQRRGASGSSMATVWTSLAAAGGVLAVVAFFLPWYGDDRLTLTAANSGWLPIIGLVLIIGGALALVGKQIGLISADTRIHAELFNYVVFGVGSLFLMARQLFVGDLSNAVYLLSVLVVALAIASVSAIAGRRLFAIPNLQRWAAIAGVLVGIRILIHLAQGNPSSAVTWLVGLVAVGLLVGFAQVRPGSATLEIEQLALGLAAMGGSIILLKRILDTEFVLGGWIWAIIAAAAVLLAAMVASQYLGILSVFQVMLFMALAISMLFVVVLLVRVVGDGWPVLGTRLDDFWSGTLRSQSDSDRLGISQGLLGSIWIALFVILLAFPIGIASAIYLEEYAPRNWFTNLLDIVVRNLAGVPSVVYGLLGLFLFVQSTAVLGFLLNIVNAVFGPIHNAFASSEYQDVVFEGGQSSLFAGGVTLAILVLPIVIITAAEAVRAVPQSLREGAYGVGATKWEVIRSQVLPFAAPGILTGTLLSLSRAIGEAAPLILVGAITGRLAPRGSMFEGFDSFFAQFADRFTAMPIVIVGWVEESGRDPGFTAAAGAAIVVLLVCVIVMNSIAVLLRNYFEQKRA